MRSSLPAICLPLVLSLSTMSAAWSADIQKGLTTYLSGDYANALREWTPLAKQGDAHAQNMLGVMHRNGWAVLQNHKTAVKWYRLAAEQGNARAHSNLGWMYRNGEGVIQDYVYAHM